MNVASRNGRLVVQHARRGGRGASGRLVAAAMPILLACGGAEGAGVAGLELVTALDAGDSLSALTRPAAYAGALPCDDCASESSVLVLEPDGSYRLRTVGASRADTVLTLGRWTLTRDSVPVLVLRGEEGDRGFEVVSPLRIRLLGAADERPAPEGRRPATPAAPTSGELVRVSAPPTLGGVLRARVEFRAGPGAPTIVTCDGGRLLPVRGADALVRLQQLHAAHPLGDGAATRVRLFGRLARDGDGATAADVAVVDSFAPLPAREPCETMRIRAHVAVGDWQATALDGVDLTHLPATARPSLRFVLSEPTMFGHATCHRFSGAAVLRGLDLAPGTLRITPRPCSDTLAVARDARYSQILSTGGWFRLDGAELVLSQGGMEMVRYRRR